MKIHPRTARIAFYFLIAALILALAPSGRAASVTNSALGPLRAEMRAEHYAPAVALADKLIAAKAAEADEALYLKALALFNAKKFPEAASTADQLAESFPKSVWRYKATFLKAQSLVEQKRKDKANE